MADIKDERGFNQIFEDTYAAKIRKRRRCEYMIDQMNPAHLNEKIKILEIGCGTGEALHYIAERTGTNCLGLDLSEKFISSANKKFGRNCLAFIKADFNDSKSFTGELKYNSFDYIIGNGILHHLYYDLDKSLANLYKLLKEGGKIIFIEPNIYNPYVALIFKIPYLRRKTYLEPDEMAFSGRFIKSKLRAAKFNACSATQKDFLLPNIPDKYVNIVIRLGDWLEKTPLTYIAQSVFITAKK